MGLPSSERNTIQYGELIPAAATTFYKGWVVGVGTDDGMVKNLSGTNAVRPLGICNESKTVSVAGSENVEVLVGTFWLSNSSVNTVSGSHVGKLCAAEISSNTATVGTSFVGNEVMGRVVKVNSSLGVAVRLDPATTPISGSTNL